MNGPKGVTYQVDWTDQPAASRNQYLREVLLVANARGTDLVAATQVLECYADESGIQAGSERCVVVGYLASPRKWIRFSEAWLAALEKGGASVFHAKDFFGRVATGAVGAKELVMFRELLAVIASHDIRPHGSEVITADFHSRTYGERQFLTGGVINRGVSRIVGGAPSRPYHVAFIHLLIVAAKAVKPGKYVDFVFDEQKQYEGLALNHFIEAKMAFEANPRLLADHATLGGCRFDSKVRWPPLQAADLLAHCLYNRKRVALPYVHDSSPGSPYSDETWAQAVIWEVPKA